MRRIKALKQRGISSSAAFLLFFAGFISLCITGYAATPLEGEVDTSEALEVVIVTEEGTFGLEEESNVRGFLVIAHGFTMEWNDMVCEAMSELTQDEKELYEICFLEDFIGDGMGYIAPREAYDTLVERGATEIVGVPVFIDSSSNHITEVRYVLGLEEMDEPEKALVEARIQGDVPIAGLTPAIDGHPIAGEAFARMILDADDPAKENRAILIAHGPNTDTEEEKWEANLGSLYEVLASELPTGFFVEHQLMTLRVLDFPHFPERLTELGIKLKEFAGKGEVFLLYLHISPGYLDMIVQGLPLDNIIHMIFPGCLDELTPDELANVVHLSTGFCEMGILPAIVRARAEEWMIGEDAEIHTENAFTEEP